MGRPNQSKYFGKVDQIGGDILREDVMGVDILGVDVMALIHLNI